MMFCHLGPIGCSGKPEIDDLEEDRREFCKIALQVSICFNEVCPFRSATLSEAV